MNCNRCGRKIVGGGVPWHNCIEHVVKMRVVHDNYGCDTGCCGHRIYGYDDRGVEVFDRFEFAHPYDDDYAGFALRLVNEQFKGHPVRDVQIDYSEVQE